MARSAHPVIQFHRIHLPTLSSRLGSQNGGILLRDGQVIPPFPWPSLPPRFTTAHPNARWSLDFLSDSFGAARRFRILAVIDDCCRENLCLIADASISGARVARELDALVRIYGKPAYVVSDNVLCAE